MLTNNYSLHTAILRGEVMRSGVIQVSLEDMYVSCFVGSKGNGNQIRYIKLADIPAEDWHPITVRNDQAVRDFFNWISEHTWGKWSFDAGDKLTFYFERVDEAMHFRLIFGDLG